MLINKSTILKVFLVFFFISFSFLFNPPKVYAELCAGYTGSHSDVRCDAQGSGGNQTYTCVSSTVSNSNCFPDGLGNCFVGLVYGNTCTVLSGGADCVDDLLGHAVHCSPGGGGGGGGCTDACTAGATRCTGTALETCSNTDSDSCTDGWVTTINPAPSCSHTACNNGQCQVVAGGNVSNKCGSIDNPLNEQCFYRGCSDDQACQRVNVNSADADQPDQCGTETECATQCGCIETQRSCSFLPQSVSVGGLTTLSPTGFGAGTCTFNTGGGSPSSISQSCQSSLGVTYSTTGTKTATVTNPTNGNTASCSVTVNPAGVGCSAGQTDPHNVCSSPLNICISQPGCGTNACSTPGTSCVQPTSTPPPPPIVTLDACMPSSQPVPPAVSAQLTASLAFSNSFPKRYDFTCDLVAPVQSVTTTASTASTICTYPIQPAIAQPGVEVSIDPGTGFREFAETRIVIFRTGPPPACPATTPTPTPSGGGSGGGWVKLKDSSFAGLSSLNNPIPAIVTAYDRVDDTTEPSFIIPSTLSDPGEVIAGTINVGAGAVSSKGWRAEGINFLPTTRVSSFIDYVKARKSYQTIALLSGANINASNTIYLVKPGDQTIAANFASAWDNIVIIVDGNLTISTPQFNPPGNSIAILVRGNLTINPAVTELKGIFIVQGTINTVTANTGLKVIGNLITQTALVNGRTNSVLSSPSIFIVFRPDYYRDLLPYLSINTYDWRQLQ